MNQQDKQLITNLAQRLHQGNNQLQKDPEAEVIIKGEIESVPNAVYQLTQAVLLQEHALQNAQNQIQVLQQQVQALQMQAQQPKRGFFSNLFGGGQNQNYRNFQNQPNQMGYQNNFNQGAYQQPQMHYGGGSSFLRSAATTAVGVAGGMALFEGVSSLFSGGNEAVANATDMASGMAPDMMNQSQEFINDPQSLADGFGAGGDDFLNQGDLGGGFGDFGDGGDFGGGDWF
ncbi:DUF2076 domain-containing protein [Thiotrichales bacterium 19X7-9]|nr:DUF2076 domain-containing protein [Thiotrichales bacterium 19X7-9]